MCRHPGFQVGRTPNKLKSLACRRKPTLRLRLVKPCKAHQFTNLTRRDNFPVTSNSTRLPLAEDLNFSAKASDLPLLAASDLGRATLPCTSVFGQRPWPSRSASSAARTKQRPKPTSRQPHWLVRKHSAIKINSGLLSFAHSASSYGGGQKIASPPPLQCVPAGSGSTLRNRSTTLPYQLVGTNGFTHQSVGNLTLPPTFPFGCYSCRCPRLAHHHY